MTEFSLLHLLSRYEDHYSKQFFILKERKKKRLLITEFPYVFPFHLASSPNVCISAEVFSLKKKKLFAFIFQQPHIIIINNLDFEVFFFSLCVKSEQTIGRRFTILIKSLEVKTQRYSNRR